MIGLILILLIVVVVGRIMGRDTAIAKKLDFGSSSFERWAAQSYVRIFGLPLALASAFFFVAKFTGLSQTLASMFGLCFVLFIFYALAHAAGFRWRVRLGIKMMFLTIVFGEFLSLLLR